MNIHDVIIIGGGISGLSAAAEASALGCKVLLLEQRRQCGGRAYSFRDTVTSDFVDNGQHLMMGCYHATRRYMRLIRTEHLASLQPALRIEFLNPSRHTASLVCPNLPAPLHILGGLIGFTAVPLKDRLQMLKIAKEMLYTSAEKEQTLDRITAEEWLTELGQSDVSRKFLWDIITIGALNNHPKNVSALMLFRVLRAAFLGQRENSSLLIPRAGLSELLVNPALEFIKAHGGEVRIGVDVAGLKAKGSNISSVQTTDGKEFFAKTFICAVPWYALEKISLTSASRKLAGLHHNRFHPSPIVSIHIWLDRKVTDLDFAALTDTRVQWLFNKSHEAYRQVSKRTDKKNIKQHLSLVISGAQEFTGLNKEQLVNIAMEDLRKVLPLARDAKVIHSLVIKEKRATFLPYPGLETLRPDAQTEFANLFLAGDWTATGYPATIEGAVMSGKKAAELVEYSDTTISVNRQNIHSLRGKLKEKGLVKALMTEKNKERQQ